MTDPWTDPETGAIVTSTLNWVYIKLGALTKGVPRHGLYQGNPAYARIVARWKAPRDE